MIPAYPLVIIGDLHGRLDLLTEALQALQLATPDGRWTGGSRRLVQLGDVIDRGPTGLAALRFLRGLQEQAQAAGGDVTLLLGNHELFALASGVGEHGARMSWLYNGGAAGYVEWAGSGSSERDWPFPEEFYGLFAPEGEFGSWLRRHSAATVVGDILIVHAGPFGGKADDLNADLRAVLSDPELLRQRSRASSDPLLGTDGPFWSREPRAKRVQASLKANGARTLVAGHTVTGGIKVSAGGRLIQIDVGMTISGTWACLSVDEAGTMWAVMQGGPPEPISGDDFFPLRARGRGRSKPQSPRRKPGDWIQLYASADGGYQQYFVITAVSDVYGHNRYQGLHVLDDKGDVEARPALWPAELIDRLGRPVEPSPNLRLAVEQAV